MRTTSEWDYIRSKMSLLNGVSQNLSDVINLSPAELEFSPPSRVISAISAALTNGITHYCSNRGLPELLDCIAAEYPKSGVNNSEIIVTSGAGEGLFSLLMSFVSTGDEILLPNPTYQGFAPKIVAFGGTPTYCKLTEDWHLDFDEIERGITSRTKAIIICNPNNPTGAVYSETELRQLVEIASAHNLILVSDESYGKITYDGVRHTSLVDMIESKERCYVVNSFSKSYAMTGIRLGYVISSGYNIEKIDTISFQIHGCVAPAIQYGGVAALISCSEEVKRMVSLHQAKRDLIVQGIRKSGFECYKPQGGLEVFPDMSNVSSDSFELSLSLLKEARILSRPGIVFGPDGRGHVRFSYGTDKNQIEEAVERLVRWSGALSQ